MSERSPSTGKLLIILGIGTCVLLANAIPLKININAEANDCRVQKGLLGKFQPTKGKVEMPETVFFDGDGKERRLTNLLGRGVILNFWASWCAPCVREMPQLDRLKQLVRDKNVEVLAVSQDRQGSAVVGRFLTVNKLYNLEPLVDRNGSLIRAVNARGLPTTIMFNPDGTELGRVTGVAEWDSPDAVAFIRKCLGN